MAITFFAQQSRSSGMASRANAKKVSHPRRSALDSSTPDGHHHLL